MTTPSVSQGTQPAPTSNFVWKEIRMKSGPNQIPDLMIEFSDNAEFDLNKGVVIRVDKHYRPITSHSLGPRTFICHMKGATASFRISETFGQNLGIRAEALFDDIIVTRSTNLDAEEKETPHWVIVMCFKNPQKTFTLGLDGFYPDKNISRTCSAMGLIDRNQQPFINRCSFVRITVPNFKSINNPGVFQPDLCQQIVTKQFTNNYKMYPVDYKQRQVQAIQAEDRENQQKLQGLKRMNQVSARFQHLPIFTNRYILQFHSVTSWSVEPQNKIFIQDAQPNNPQSRGNFFRQDPGKSSESTTGKQNVWQGTTFLQGNTVCCIIDNHLPATVRQQIEVAISTNHIFEDLHIAFKEDSNEMVVNRQTEAMRVLEWVMDRQLGIDTKKKNPTAVEPDMNLVYKLPLSSYFLEERPKLENKNISIKLLPKYSIEAIYANPKNELQEPSHQNTLHTCFGSPNGISIIQGPPATGKTTLVSKLVGIVRYMSDLEGGSVVVVAQTTEAVLVACTRTLDTFAKMFDMKEPWKEVCLVLSENTSQFWRFTGKSMQTKVQNATLEAHLDRAAANRPEFATYRAGRVDMKAHGYLTLNNNQIKHYRQQRRILIDEIKGKVKVWFSRLANCHMKHEIFGHQKNLTPLPTRLLIIDEASQATDPFITMAVLATNPGSIILAGDENQLAPFTLNFESQLIWQKSMFVKLKKKGFPSQMLLMQYRTTANIYAGTNVHYGGNVKSHPSTINRPYYHRLMHAIRQISFKDATGQKHQLTSNCHVFNMVNSQTKAAGSTSSENEMEQQFIWGFLKSLYKAGISMQDIMALTAYQGQYDLMMNHESELPGRGLKIRKINSSQGDENEIVIFSLVREKTKGLGFQTNPRRQNVATSRSREGQFLVGQIETMLALEARPWSKWMDGLEAANPKLMLTFEAPVIWSVGNFTLTHSEPGPPRPPTTEIVRSYDTTKSHQPAGISTSQPSHARSQSSTSQGQLPRSSSTQSIPQSPGNQLARSDSVRSQQGQIPQSSSGQFQPGHTRTTSGAGSIGGHSNLSVTPPGQLQVRMPPAPSSPGDRRFPTASSVGQGADALRRMSLTSPRMTTVVPIASILPPTSGIPPTGMPSAQTSTSAAPPFFSSASTTPTSTVPPTIFPAAPISSSNLEPQIRAKEEEIKNLRDQCNLISPANEAKHFFQALLNDIRTTGGANHHRMTSPGSKAANMFGEPSTRLLLMFAKVTEELERLKK